MIDWNSTAPASHVDTIRGTLFLFIRLRCEIKIENNRTINGLVISLPWRAEGAERKYLEIALVLLIRLQRKGELQGTVICVLATHVDIAQIQFPEEIQVKVEDEVEEVVQQNPPKVLKAQV